MQQVPFTSTTLFNPTQNWLWKLKPASMALHQFPAFYIFICYQQNLSLLTNTVLHCRTCISSWSFQARKTSKTNFISYKWPTLQSHLIPPLCQLHNWELKQTPGTVHNSPFVLLFLCLKNWKKTEKDDSQIHFHAFLTIHSAPLSLTKRYLQMLTEVN